jgi:V-type H+-transporting ATPase subunit d
MHALWWLCLLVLCAPQLGYGESQMLDKLLYEEEVKRCMACFEQQFHYGVFYAYMKLREQEIRNVMWISECVAQVGMNSSLHLNATYVTLIG